MEFCCVLNETAYYKENELLATRSRKELFIYNMQSLNLPN